MTCKNCGKELSPETKFCDNCGTKVENVTPAEEAQSPEAPVEAPIAENPAEETPVAETPAEETPVAEAPAEETPVAEAPAEETPVAEAPAEETPEEIPPEEKPPKKSKKGLLVGIGIAVVIIAAVAIAFPFIKNFFAKTFTPNDVYLKNVERAAVEDAVDVVALALDEYASLVPEDTDSFRSFYDSKKVDVDLSVDFSDAIVNYISDSADMDLSFLKNVDLGYYFAIKDDDLGLGLDLGLENKKLISADAILDLKDFITYLTVPELSDTAMKLDLEALTGEDLSGILESEDTSAILENAFSVYSSVPDGKTVKSIVMRYTDIILDQIDTVEKSDETVNVGEISKKYTALTAVFTPDDLEELSVALLTKLKDDGELWEMLETLAGAVSPEGAESIRYSRDELAESYDSMVADVDGTFDNIGNVTYTAYVDQKGSVIGRSFVCEDGSSFSLMTANDGKDSAFELEVKEMGLDVAALVLNMTESGDTCDGNAVIGIEGTDALNVEFKDVKLDGTAAEMIFTPTEAMSELLKDVTYEIESEPGVDLEALGIDLTKSAVTVRLETDVTEDMTGDVKYGIALVSNGVPALSAEIKTSYGETDGFDIPEEYKEVNSEMGLISWLSTADIIGFIGTLPEELSGVIMNAFMPGLS